MPNIALLNNETHRSLRVQPGAAGYVPTFPNGMTKVVPGAKKASVAVDTIRVQAFVCAAVVPV